MSISINILNDKLPISKGNYTFMDLTTKSFNSVDDDNYELEYVVDDTMVMRPDILAMTIKNSMDFSELLKENYISNPFTLDNDDVISIRTTGPSKIVSPKATMQDSDSDIRNKYVNPDKATTPDRNIKKLTEKFKNLKNLAVGTPSPSISNLPPNFNEFGKGEVEVINNKVRFAPGVARNNSECSTEPISKAELISKVLKNKLNNI